MAPVGTGAVFGFGVENPKFERYFARIDSQEHVRKVACWFICHNAFCFSAQRKVSILPMQGSLTSGITAIMVADMVIICQYYSVMAQELKKDKSFSTM